MRWSLLWENRGELEKVLEHYNDSGLKQDAARFMLKIYPQGSRKGEIA
ncbi:hypothetical protein NXV95_19755 [Bacteroides fragilis]|nr:hypothetical protein [Bacteroides fragilis]